MIKKKIMVLGDSLSFGFLPLNQGQMNPNFNWPKKLVFLLNEYYQDKYNFEIAINAKPGRTIIKPLINFGFEQDNAWEKVDEMLANNSPFDFLIIFLGTNDYFGYDALNSNTKLLSTKELTIKVVESLEKLVDIISEKVETSYHFFYKPIIVIPPKVLLQNGSNLLSDFPEIYQKCFASKNIPTVNLQINANPQREDLHKYDGIHYVPEDNDKVAECIFNLFIDAKLLMNH